MFTKITIFLFLSDESWLLLLCIYQRNSLFVVCTKVCTILVYGTLCERAGLSIASAASPKFRCRLAMIIAGAEEAAIPPQGGRLHAWDAAATTLAKNLLSQCSRKGGKLAAARPSVERNGLLEEDRM